MSTLTQRSMRLLYFIVLSIFLVSCKQDLDSEFEIKKIPVFDIEVPSTLLVDVEYSISFKYALSNGCYSFYDYAYDIKNDNVRIVTALAKVAQADVCTQEYKEGSFSFLFKPIERKTYIFKFWIGQNAQGDDEYETYELIVE